jgi:hypothetical protein
VSKEHLHLPPLSEKQYQAIFKLTGEDPLKVFTFERKKQIGIYVMGKGSGKDYMISVLLSWLFHIILCMVDPHSFLDFPKDENIDILNVAPTAQQAEKIFFSKFKSRLRNWKWLTLNFKVTHNGKALRGCTGSRMEIRVTDTSIECTNNVRFFSLHAQAENYEGFSVLVAILDESSSYEDKYDEVTDADGEVVNVGKADLIYNTLRTSAASRKIPWMLISISFPRRENDFSLVKLEEAQKDPDGIMIYERGCTWDYNPRFFDEPTFKFEEWDVPLSLKPDFDNDPSNSRMKYCTVPPIVLNRFFWNDERIQSAIDEKIEPLLVLQDDVMEIIDANGKKTKFAIKKVMASNLANRELAYAVGVDLSINKDKTVAVIGHGEPCNIRSTFIDPEGKQELKEIHTRVIIDQIITWIPDIKKKILSSHYNCDEILEQLQNLTGYSYISYDQYQSQYVLEKCLRNGIVSEKHNIKDNDYILFRNLLHAGAISIPKHPMLIFEMERLIYDGRRVDHLPQFGKDHADAVCHVVRAIAGGFAKAKGSMAFTFAEDIMFAPDGAINPTANMPKLPMEALINSAEQVNPNDFGIYF